MAKFTEIQCDGLIGPTHNYSGLSFGNIASANNAENIAYPKKAALQGLEKMRFVHKLGCTQLILPPPKRPNMALLEQHNIQLDSQSLGSRLHEQVVRAAWSASTMWSANAATVTPATDSSDNETHITIANLASSLHRAQEATERFELLHYIFSDVATIHPALLPCAALADEGAANHMRLAPAHGEAGVEIFVYGRDVNGIAPVRYPARQTKLSCEAIAHMHHLPPERTIITQQHPDAIDAGVFHNDVIAMSNEQVLIYHEMTFYDEAAFLEELHNKAAFPLTLIKISNDQLSIEDAVQSYLYNSQLLTIDNQKMVIVAPKECQDNKAAYNVLERIKGDNNDITDVFYLDVRESMRNGGGPACLRLRIVLNDEQTAKLPEPFLFNESTYNILVDFINTHYPDTFAPEQINDAEFAKQCLGIQNEMMELFLVK